MENKSTTTPPEFEILSNHQKIASIKPILIQDINATDTRNILILMIKKINNQNKNYLKIIGIDIFTGITVNIVDTNGSKIGLHSYQGDLAKLQPSSIIQAKFRMFESDYHLNTLRIVSTFKILGQSNINQFINKYYRLSLMHPNNITISFDNVLNFLNEHHSSKCNFMVNFTGTQLKKYKGKYQFKMKDLFVNIDEEIYNNHLLDSEDTYFKGWMLIEFVVNINGVIKATAQISHLLPIDYQKILEDKKRIKEIEKELHKIYCQDIYCPELMISDLDGLMLGASAMYRERADFFNDYEYYENDFDISTDLSLEEFANECYEEELEYIAELDNLSIEYELEDKYEKEFQNIDFLLEEAENTYFEENNYKQTYQITDLLDDEFATNFKKIQSINTIWRI